MFRAYIDESAESGNAVFAVGGFAGTQELEPLWLDALPKGAAIGVEQKLGCTE